MSRSFRFPRASLLLIAGLLLTLAAAPAGALPGSLHGAPGPLDVALDSGDLLAGGEAVPLSAPTPDWYTPDLHEQVLAAGAEGVEIPEGVELPASALAFQGIRPGSWMLSPAWCTMNFVFGANDSIGTAGHCAEVGDEVVLVMAPGVMVYIGDAVRSVDNGVGDDFALVSIRSEVRDLVNPSMAIIAGPTGGSDPSFGDVVAHVGHGIGVGTGGTARTGVVTFTEGTAYAWDGAAAPGDSGSAVRDALGDAAGNLTHLVIGGPYVPAVVAGTTVSRMEQIAGRSVATADLVPDPLP